MACTSLIVAGGTVQVGGFGLALAQSVRTRREESPEEASLIGWTRAWLRRSGGEAATWVRVKAEPMLRRLHLIGPRVASGAVTMSTGATLSARGHKAINNRERPMEERADRLEDAVNELYRDAGEHRHELTERVGELRRGVEDREAARESERARQLGRRLRYEELGVGVFVVGVVLTTVGSL